MLRLSYFNENDSFKEKFNSINTSIECEEAKFFKDCDPEMVFFGTGSMMPSLYRNVSAIYLRFWQ